MKWIFLAPILLLCACGSQGGNGYNKFLANTDRVDIVVFNGGDTLNFETRDSTGIRILSNLISGNPARYNDTCTAEGYLRYLSAGTVLFQARFAANKGGCNYVAYSDDDASYAHRLSDRAKNLLNKVMEQAGKQ